MASRQDGESGKSGTGLIGRLGGALRDSRRPGGRVLRSGNAMRVIFFYPGEEGTYVDEVNVTLFENGIVHIASEHEQTTTHIHNCEILWTFKSGDAEDRASGKIRLLKPKGPPPPQE